MKIITREEMNPFYDPDNAGNGGGYSQPYIVVEMHDGSKLEIEDTSCGDYGTRIMATYKAGAPDQRCAHWGTMLKDELAYSDFTSDDISMLEEVRGLTGYSIPIEDDFR